jgi:hypothetical protein
MARLTENQTEAFNKTTEKGVEDGLFQESMKSIHSGHVRSNRLRAGLVVAGMFTDKSLYAEVVSLFYVVTKELELKLESMASGKNDEICKRILSLGYHFTEEYEKDLSFLFSDEAWQNKVEIVAKKSPAVVAYRELIQRMSTGSEVAGAAFVLWGALIIGGGAMAMPRVEKLCGKEATHLFQAVTGPGREERKKKFIQLWDSLAEARTPEFAAIVSNCQQCMQYNNTVFTSIHRTPWWLPYVISGLVAVGSSAVYFLSWR